MDLRSGCDSPIYCRLCLSVCHRAYLAGLEYVTLDLGYQIDEASPLKPSRSFTIKPCYLQVPSPHKFSARQGPIPQVPSGPIPATQTSIPPGPFLHQISQSQISPCGFPSLLCSPLDSKCRMLIWHYIVLIFRIQWLVVRRDVDVVIRQLVFAEIFKEVCVSRPVKMHVSMVRIFRLVPLVSMLGVCCEDDQYHPMITG